MVLVLALPGCFGEGCNVTTPTPYPPSDLVAVAVFFSEIKLTWKDNSPDETGFYIYRKTTGSYSKVAATEANSTSYNDTGLSPNTTYWYRVCTHNAGGNSEFSNEASATTPFEQAKPAAPTNLIATVVNCNRVDLRWQDNSDNEDGFKVFRTSAGETVYHEIADLDSNTTFYSNPVSASSVYWYHTQAYNSGGIADSNPVRATTPAEVIVDYHMEEEFLVFEWWTDIVGTVKNNTDRTLSICIRGEFFNQKDVLVSTKDDWVDFLGAGETGQFKISYRNKLKERISRIEAWVHYYYGVGSSNLVDSAKGDFNP